MDEKKNNRFVYFAAASVNLMSFVAGTGYGWTSPYLPKLNGNVDPEDNPLPQPTTTLEDSWITSLHSLGALCGPLLTGTMTNRFGKKKTLLIFSVPLFIANLIYIFANSVGQIYVARFLLGVGTGCVFSVVPSFLAEISDTSNRGRISMLMPFMITFSNIFVSVIGPYVSISTFGIISLVPSVIFFLVFGLLIPESPYYFVMCDEFKEARLSLAKYRQGQNIEKELTKIIADIEGSHTKVSFKDIIKSKRVRKSLLITLGLMFFQQFSGAQSLNSYQQGIFDASGDFIPGHISVMIVAVVQFFALMVTLRVIDTVGRKKLLLFSFTGLLVCLLSLGIYFHFKIKNANLDSVLWLPLVSLTLYMTCFKLGAGPIPWTIIGEIFPANLKSYLSALVTFIMTLMSFVVSFGFPLITEFLGMDWSLWLFALIVTGSIIFIILVVPETKGYTFMEIQNLLK